MPLASDNLGLATRQTQLSYCMSSVLVSILRSAVLPYHFPCVLSRNLHVGMLHSNGQSHVTTGIAILRLISELLLWPVLASGFLAIDAVAILKIDSHVGRNWIKSR